MKTPFPLRLALYAASLFFILGTHASTATAQSLPDSSLAPVGRWSWTGWARGIAAYGDTLIVGNYMTMAALDVSHLPLVRVAGEMPNMPLADVQVRDTLAFVSAAGYLHILNLSRLDSIVDLGSVFVPGGADRIILQDTVSFVLGVAGNVAAVDISDIRAPRVRGHVVAGGLNKLRGLFTASGRTIYVQDADELASGSIVNATNLDALFIQRPFNLPFFASGGAVRDTLLVALSSSRLQLFYSIVDPWNPVALSELTQLEYPQGIVIRDTLVYICDAVGLNVVSVADPVAPRLVSTSPSQMVTQYAGGKLVFTSRYAVSEYPRGLSLASFVGSRRDSLQEVYTLPLVVPERITLSKGVCYVASGEAGLWVVDAHEPTRLRSLAALKLGGSATDVAAAGNVCYVAVTADSMADSSGGLWVVSVADPSRPSVLAHYQGIAARKAAGAGAKLRLSLAGHLLAMAVTGGSDADSLSLELLDVTAPGAPTPLWRLTSQDPIEDVALSEAGGGTGKQLLAVGRKSTGIGFWDVSTTPLQPVLVGELSEHAMAIQAAAGGGGDSLFYAVTDSGLASIALDPLHLTPPHVVGRSPGHRSVLKMADLCLSDGFAYWTDSTAHAVDVHDPMHLQERFAFQTETPASAVAAEGNLALCAETAWIGAPAGKVDCYVNDQVVAVDGSQKQGEKPADFVLSQNYPNPFNPSTTIRFTLPVRTAASLTVHNTLGQLVATLVANESYEAGTHMLHFDGSHLASGLYFYTLHAAGRMIVRKMLLLK